MKQIFLSSVLLAFVLVSFAQEEMQGHTLSGSDYMKKSKTQKTWAWVLTGIGAAGFTGFLIADMEQSLEGGITTIFSLGYEKPEYKSYTAGYIISGAVLAAGITLFFTSSANKKKARSASAFMDMETAPTIQRAMAVQEFFPTIGIKLQL